MGLSFQRQSNGNRARKKEGRGKKRSLLLIYQNIFFGHVLSYQRFLLNMYYYISGFCEYKRLSQRYYSICIKRSTLFLIMY